MLSRPGVGPGGQKAAIAAAKLDRRVAIVERRHVLTRDRTPFEVGVARYRDLARGQIIGDSYGMLKLLVAPDTRELLGVHVFGTGATELVHIGQAVMGCHGTVDYLVDAVFNYPTWPSPPRWPPSTR